MKDEKEELRKRLDEVVGTAFDERGERWRAAWLRRSLPRWIAGILLGIAMAALVWWILDSHLKAAHHAPPHPQPKRPVTVDILPAR